MIHSPPLRACIIGFSEDAIACATSLVMALCRSPALGFPCACGRSVSITSGALSFGAFFGADFFEPPERKPFFRFPFRPSPNCFFMRCCSLFFAASFLSRATFASAIICSISDGPSSCGGGGGVGSDNGGGASSSSGGGASSSRGGGSSPDMSNSLRAARAERLTQ